MDDLNGGGGSGGRPLTGQSLGVWASVRRWIPIPCLPALGDLSLPRDRTHCLLLTKEKTQGKLEAKATAAELSLKTPAERGGFLKSSALGGSS